MNEDLILVWMSCGYGGWLSRWVIAEARNEKPGIAAKSRELAPEEDGAGAAGAQAHPSAAVAEAAAAGTAKATVN